MPISTIFSASGKAGRVWEAVLASAKAMGQSEKGLQREVDIGYTEDAHLLPRSYNKRGSVEAEEVFEYAYAQAALAESR